MLPRHQGINWRYCSLGNGRLYHWDLKIGKRKLKINKRDIPLEVVGLDFKSESNRQSLQLKTKTINHFTINFVCLYKAKDLARKKNHILLKYICNFPCILEVVAAWPNFIDLLKQKILLNNFLLSRNEQETSHKLYMWHWLVTFFSGKYQWCLKLCMVWRIKSIYKY